jgi:RHS repeat-associated protein
VDPLAADAGSVLKAKYEYDAYGQQTGYTSLVYEQPFRFSTKYWDPETGLGYWIYRYYSPELGRWISRDPIGEQGGTNIYGYVGNQPTVYADPLGFDRKSYEYDIESPPCGLWIICPIKKDRSEIDPPRRWSDVGWDPENVPGFEVRFETDHGEPGIGWNFFKECPCGCDKNSRKNIRIIQVVESGGRSAHIDPPKPYKGYTVDPNYPHGYTEAGGQKGDYPHQSHQDNPKFGKDGHEHKFEICAVCKCQDRDKVLGCVAFEYYDGKLGKGGRDTEIRGFRESERYDEGRYKGKGCFARTSKAPGKLYKEGIRRWRRR